MHLVNNIYILDHIKMEGRTKKNMALEVQSIICWKLTTNYELYQISIHYHPLQTREETSKCKKWTDKSWESGDFPPEETEHICSQAHAHF